MQGCKHDLFRIISVKNQPDPGVAEVAMSVKQQNWQHFFQKMIIQNFSRFPVPNERNSRMSQIY
ncbi:uncharacterized protein METZ01_LOCUS406710 [marine metagenome]|uniref:Uncharacterized protein n=1 Tax=marine metagenome TaxID=408172 RepID=A0A382W4S9_9ZZZZ